MDPEQIYPTTVPSCLSLDEAKAMVAGFVQAFHSQDVDSLAQGWTEDVVIRFADLPEIRGKQAAKQWVASRFARQRDYRLVKTFQAVTGDILGDSWTGAWTDAQTGKKMQG
ncbi:MAG: nuclear transport factor 2 family protein, partial [Proteobacteria bacterium]|nr:nuclear transport factor 2 family protein [Pseudomonadota bacterium]